MLINYIYNGRKYRVFRCNDNTFKAEAKFDNKRVYGIAKCHPEDEFNMEFGMRLACARCAEKIAHKKIKDARRGLTLYAETLEFIQQELKRERGVIASVTLDLVGINNDIKAMYEEAMNNGTKRTN